MDTPSLHENTADHSRNKTERACQREPDLTVSSQNFSRGCKPGPGRARSEALRSGADHSRPDNQALQSGATRPRANKSIKHWQENREDWSRSRTERA